MKFTKRQHQQANKLANFWKKTHQPRLKIIARIVLSMFGSTYIVREPFLYLGNIKTGKQRNRLGIFTDAVASLYWVDVFSQIDQI